MENNNEKRKYNLQFQLIKSFGNVIIAHKTQETHTDILMKKSSTIKLIQIILSAMTTGGLVTALSSIGEPFQIISTYLSTFISIILLTISSYNKNYKLDELAEKHRCAAIELWQVREEYNTLITKSEFIDYNDLDEKFSKLQKDLRKIYQKVPRTSTKAYIQSKEKLNTSYKEKNSLKSVIKFLPPEIIEKFKLNECIEDDKKESK